MNDEQKDFLKRYKALMEWLAKGTDYQLIETESGWIGLDERLVKNPEAYKKHQELDKKCDEYSKDETMRKEIEKIWDGLI